MSKAAPGSIGPATGIPFRNLLTFPSRFRYIAWKLSGSRGTLRCRLRDGPKISIRPRPSDDYDTAYEIFRLGAYNTGLDSARVRRVVDVGGNVGYSCLFWCWRYPKAHILTYEPHPVHSEILSSHLRANGYSDRVTLVQAGAAARATTAVLLDDDIRSTLLLDGVSNPRNRPGIEIRTVDFFETVGRDPIDILKIDIEGGEYELLQDPRFDQVAGRVECIIMEWHKRAPHHLGGQWCADRLSGLGFIIGDAPHGGTAADIGVLSARKPAGA